MSFNSKSRLGLQLISNTNLDTQLWRPSSQPGRIRYHMYTAWLFVSNDILNLPVVGLIFGAVSAYFAPIFSIEPALSSTEILLSIPFMAIWLWAHLFLFNLHNQLRSRDEDSLNKPWRPIPAGRINEQQTGIVLCCVYPATMIMAAYLGGQGTSLSFIAMCISYNEFGGSENPWLKNLLNGIGMSCFFVGPLEVVLRRSVLFGEGNLTVWLSIILAAMSVTTHVQDFRDMEGDKQAGRQTIPLAIGEGNARAVVVLGAGIFTGFACWFWGASFRESALAYISAAVLAGNVCLNRTRQGDDFSYKKLWYLWILGLLFLPFLKEMI